MTEQRCLFCGGDASEPNHWEFCDGRQGGRDDPIVITVTITTPRATSVQAFYNAVDAGIIETRRAEVWSSLQALGVATTNEVFEHLKRVRRSGIRYDSTVKARMTELRDLGLVREVGERSCSVTGQTCITWTVVPSSEYAGAATLHRCQLCGHIVSKEVPVLVTKD